MRVWLDIPEGMKVQLPQDMAVESAIANFEAHYNFTDEREIMAVRTFEINTDEVSPEDCPLYKQVINTLLEDARPWWS